MPTVIISRLSYTSGEAIAGKVAAELGYRCIDAEVFDEASRTSGVPALKLRKALEEAPSMFGSTLSVSKRYAAFIRTALAAQLLEDNVVYHGPFGHVLISGISHVVKVRIFAETEDRIARLMDREQCDRKAAGKKIAQSDKHRLSIGEMVFGVNDDDPGLFNLVINTSQEDEETVAGVICETIRHDRHRPNTYSIDSMIDLELSCRLKASLMDIDPDIQVYVKRGDVKIRATIGGRSKEKKLNEIKQKAERQDGVTNVTIDSVAPLADQIDKRLR